MPRRDQLPFIIINFSKSTPHSFPITHAEVRIISFREFSQRIWFLNTDACLKDSFLRLKYAPNCLSANVVKGKFFISQTKKNDKRLKVIGSFKSINGLEKLSWEYYEKEVFFLHFLLFVVSIVRVGCFKNALWALSDWRLHRVSSYWRINNR